MPCCTDADSWSWWSAPISSAALWRPQYGHDPSLDFAVTEHAVEIELCYSGSPASAIRELVVLDRSSFEAAIGRADADV